MLKKTKEKSKIERRTMLTGVRHDMDHLHFILIFEIESVEHVEQNAKLKTLSHVKNGISIVIYFILRIFCTPKDVFKKQLFYCYIKPSHIRCYNSKKSCKRDKEKKNPSTHFPFSSHFQLTAGYS